MMKIRCSIFLAPAGRRGDRLSEYRRSMFVVHVEVKSTAVTRATAFSAPDATARSIIPCAPRKSKKHNLRTHSSLEPFAIVGTINATCGSDAARRRTRPEQIFDTVEAVACPRADETCPGSGWAARTRCRSEHRLWLATIAAWTALDRSSGCPARRSAEGRLAPNAALGGGAGGP